MEGVKSDPAETVNRYRGWYGRGVAISAIAAAMLVVTGYGSASYAYAQSGSVQPSAEEDRLPLPGSVVGTEEQLYRDIADALVQQVVTGRAGAGSDDLLAQALTVDPDNGDAMYQIALRLRGRQEDRVRRQALLAAALDARRVDTPREDVVAELAELLLAQGRSTEARNLLETESRELPGTPVFAGIRPVIGPIEDGPRGSTDPRPGRIERLYVRALLQSGPRWFSAAYLQRLRSRFPTDTELAAIDFSRSNRLSLSLLEWIDREIGGGRQIPIEVLLHGIVVADDTDVRHRLARLYRAAGGTDLLGEVADQPEYGLKIAVDHADKYVLERAVAWSGNVGDSPDVVLQHEGAPDVILLDADRDGFWEERYRHDAGSLTVWEHDIYQDGIVDQRVERFSRTSTGGLRVWHRDLSDDGVRVHGVEYAPYPNVARVTDFFQSHDGADVRLVEWRPARPIGYTLRGDGPWTTEEWNLATDRVTLDYDGITRFERQIRSDDAQRMEDAIAEDHRLQLQSWGMIQ